MKKYQACKDSGIGWIGEIPEHWIIAPIKNLAKIQNGSTPSSSNLEFWDGTIKWVTTDDLGKLKNRYISDTRRTITEAGYLSCGASIAPIGSVVISTRAPIGHIGILKIEACTNQGCKTIIVKNIDSSFCYYFFLASKDILDSLGQGSTFKELSTFTLKNFKVAIPTIVEQLKIVKFLDVKTNSIEILIEKKKQLIILLKEERTAIINNAVTKGINPNVKLKDSGVEWIGKIPEHWVITRLKFLGKAFGGLTYSPKDIVQDNKEGKLVLRSSNIQRGKLSLKDNVYVNANISDKLILRLGDILICSRNGSQKLIGKNICIDEAMAGNTFGAFMMVFRSNYWLFLKHFFNSSIFSSQSGLFLTATINQLTSNTINNFVIAFPKSFEEQNEISLYIDNKIIKIDEIVSKMEKEIELMVEYKTALISEVVTGKIDVRDEVIV